MKKLLYYFLIWGVTGGFTLVAQEPLTFIKQKQKKIRVFCLGDSITAGVGVRGKDSKYPAQLNKLLGEKYHVTRLGKSGATLLKKGAIPFFTKERMNAILKIKPQIIVIKLGTNDTQAQNWKHKDDFISDYKSILKEILTIKPTPNIYLCLPVPIFKDGRYLSSKILQKEVIPKIKKVAEDMKLPVIDLNTVLKGAGESFKDGVHPNGDGAKLIAETVHKELLKDK